MSSIIVLDSSDEETDSANKKPRIGPPVRGNQVQGQQSMARVNPLKGSTPALTAAKKTVATAATSDNNRVHLAGKRATPSEIASVDQVPKKRIKPTTVVHSSDDEWINRQKNGEQLRINPPSAAMAKILAGSAKASVSVVKNPILIGTAPRPASNSTRVVANPAAAVNSAKNASQSYVRVAMNGKPSSPPVTSKTVITALKEQSKASISPPIINKNITATVKDQSKSVPLAQQTFKNSVTIRRVVVDDRSKTSPVPKPTGNASALPKAELTTKTSLPGLSGTSIRRIPLPSDPLKVSMPAAVSTKHLNNSSLKITPITSTSAALNSSSTSIKRIPSTAEGTKVTQSLQVLKRNSNAAKPATVSSAASSTLVNSNPSSGGTITYTPATIKRIVTVDLPKTPASPPVITKNYGTAAAPKKSANEVPKSSMSMSVITKNHVKVAEPKMSPPVLPKSLSTRPSGLIVTPITCAPATACTASTSSAKTTRAEPNPTRAAPKQTKPPLNRPRPSPISTDSTMASMSTNMFNMFPSMGGFMGNSSMMYGVDPSSGSFVNPAFMANRPMNALDNVLPSMSPSVYNMNYPSFSGGSITPIKSPGTAPSPTYSTGRSSKSPVTSTVTRSSASAKSPAALMGVPIDVDQPLRPMSPTVYNMNHHPPFNGDPFGMRASTNIPSPAYSPVRSTKSPVSSAPVSKASASGNPTSESGRKSTSASSPVCYRDLDNFVRNPLSYPSNMTASTPTTGNGPVISLDSPVRNHTTGYGPSSFFKSPTSTITSPAHSTISDGSSVSEVLPTNGDTSNPKPAGDKATAEPAKDANAENAENASKEEEVKQPLNEEYKKLLDACREADSSEDMNKLIESKLIRYYYSVHPDFVKSRGFRKAVVAATESIKKNPDLVYYHLRPVVEEMKARKKCKTVVMTNDETTAAAAASEAPVKDQSIEDKVRNRQIRKLSKGLYILTRKIHKLENEDVDLDDENSSYLIVERYKKRACEIYDKICDLTGESKHALRQVKKPITFKATDYPKFNKVVEAFVNRTKEFPDFLDVLKMLEFCNDRYKFNLHKEEMTMIAQDAFIKIGKLLQSRRKADLYETVSHFTSDYEDPASNDPALLAKLSENDKNQTSIGSIIDKYAREQVRRKAESANASGDDANNTSDSCDTDGQSQDEDEPSNENNNCVKNADKECAKPSQGDTTNGKHTPPPPSKSPQIISSPSPSPSASTSAPFRISPPHAFASPQASPRPRSSSPLLPPPPPAPPASSSTETQSQSTPASTTTAVGGLEQQPQAWATNLLKILSVTSLNDSATAGDVVTEKAVTSIVDEIIISDEDL